MVKEKENKFVGFIKKYGVLCVVGIVIFAVALTFTLVASLSGSVQTGGGALNFALPMTNASVIKDFSNTELQKNETLNQWEAHLAVDLTSESKDVFAVLDGTVSKVKYDELSGWTVSITHDGGFVSVYSSLAKDNIAKEGNKVKAGDKIGEASNTSSSELELENHLHFSLQQNSAYVNPNDYLNLEIK